MNTQPNLRCSAVNRFGTASIFNRTIPIILAIALMASCASSGGIRSGVSAVYSTGLSVTLLSWKDGNAQYAGTAAAGRWLTAEVRVAYDGNAQFAEIPASAFRVAWDASDRSSGETRLTWVYDPTPGAGGAAKREALRVRMTNRFTLAFDIPAEAALHSFMVGNAAIPLSLPEAAP